MSKFHDGQHLNTIYMGENGVVQVGAGGVSMILVVAEPGPQWWAQTWEKQPNGELIMGAKWNLSQCRGVLSLE